MMNLKTISVLSIAALLVACSNRHAIPEDGSSSLALQVTRSAGSGTIIEDRTLPENGIDDVGVGGYVGSTLIGLPMGSMMTGFGLALLSDQNYGWDRANYIMYLDAATYGHLDGYQMCKVVLERFNETMPSDIDTLQAFTSTPLLASDEFYKERYNGGERLCAQGYTYSEGEAVNETVYASIDMPFLGTRVGIKRISDPIDTAIFNDVLKAQMPSDNVVAVRFVYDSSALASLRYPEGSSTDYIDAQGFATSPALTLPKATFMSLPTKQYFAKGQYIPSANGIRDNDNVYFFVKPVEGKTFAQSLKVYHQSQFETLERIKKSEK